jgi:16S rRNA (uracil1498-N3)-methyltransferase
MPLDPALVHETIELPEPIAHHAVNVLRLGSGASLTLFDGSGGEYAATLVRAEKRAATARIECFVDVERESPLALTLAHGIAAGDAMDAAVRKATELGVVSIQPLVTARSAPFSQGERGERRVAHWRQVAVAACEQCGRNRVPSVPAPRRLDEWLAAWRGRGIVFSPEAQQSVAALPRPDVPLALLIGPEGGFEAREIDAALRARFHAARLGPRVLRTDTAAAAGLAVLQSLWGDAR